MKNLKSVILSSAIALVSMMVLNNAHAATNDNVIIMESTGNSITDIISLPDGGTRFILACSAYTAGLKEEGTVEIHVDIHPDETVEINYIADFGDFGKVTSEKTTFSERLAGRSGMVVGTAEGTATGEGAFAGITSVHCSCHFVVSFEDPENPYMRCKLCVCKVS